MFIDEIDTTPEAPEMDTAAPAQDDIHDNEPSLVDKIYEGEVDFRGLDASTRKTVLKEAYNRLDDKGRAAWNNNWRDKPFFLGKDRNGNDVPWKTAEDFLKTLEVPQVKKEREGHQRLVEELRKRDQEIERLKKMTKMNLDRNLENDEAAINSEIKRAKEEFDVEALEAALERKRGLQKNKEQVKEYYETPEAPQLKSERDLLAEMPDDLRESYLDFKKENLWFGLATEPTINAFANQEYETIQFANNMTPKQKFDYVSSRVRQAFPSKFPKNNNTMYMPTTTKTASPIVKTENKNSAESLYANLPDRDKVTISNLVASGKFTSKEAVMKHYGLINK